MDDLAKVEALLLQLSSNEHERETMKTPVGSRPSKSSRIIGLLGKVLR